MKQALAELDRAADLDAESVNTIPAHALRGQVLEDLKRPKDALAAYKKALELDRTKQEILLMLIRLCLQTKDTQGTLSYLRRYVLAVGNDVSSLLLAAESYLQLGHDDEALELATRVRNICFHEKAQRITGLVYLNKGDLKKITLDTGETSFWDALQQLCRHAGLVEGAVAENLPTVEVARAELEKGLGVLAAFAEKTSLVASNGEARRQIKGGGLKVNDAAVTDEKMTLALKDLTPEGVIKLSLGRKKHVLLKPV